MKRQLITGLLIASFGLFTLAPLPAFADAAAATSTTSATPTTTSSTPTTTSATPSTTSVTPTTTSVSTTPSVTTISYPTTTTTVSSSTLTTILIIYYAVVLVLAVFLIVCLWKVFNKAGKPGWAAIVPIYNSFTILEIGDQNGWWVLIAFIPFIGALILLVIYILAALEIAKRFGKGPLFAVFGLIIFSIIGWPMLAFGKAKYNDPSGMPQGQNPPMPPSPQTPMPPTPPTPPVAPTPPTPPAPPTTFVQG